MKNKVRKLSAGVFGIAALTFLVGYAPASRAGGHPSKWTAQLPIHIKRDATTTYQSGYTPSQIRTAYGINQLSVTGANQTIAIVDAYGSPTIQQDLASFDSQFGLSSANLQIAYPNGKPHQTNSGWALETSLDVEWAHAIAPGAKIMLVVAKSASTSNLLSAINYATSHGAQVVSNSWGGSEFSGESSYNSYFQHTGVVYLASSGDSGAGTEWPAASPDVLGTGGTTLNLGSGGSYGSETAWSGSGGGQSTYESRPSYQNNWLSVTGSQRGIPDVAWDANPSTGVAVYDSTSDQGQSGWFVVGGTSVSSPSWSGLIALADQGRTSPLTSRDAISQIYNLAGTTGSTGYNKYFHDITQGNNGGYSAQPGYDLVTGIGSPQANNLIPALTAAP
ncbi:S53 family peptidase [Alicyclobacillus sp. SO9]|uniref:S53 family peptidase n=1 Tax=Alicyclobacillus sp. SO9 TaxID=2665646 RepID=UPI001E2E808F|nr:S53 family peptidase [Alicyclobacillus sp. SO9]